MGVQTDRLRFQHRICQSERRSNMSKRTEQATIKSGLTSASTHQISWTTKGRKRQRERKNREPQERGNWSPIVRNPAAMLHCGRVSMHNLSLECRRIFTFVKTLEPNSTLVPEEFSTFRSFPLLFVHRPICRIRFWVSQYEAFPACLSWGCQLPCTSRRPRKSYQWRTRNNKKWSHTSHWRSQLLVREISV